MAIATASLDTAHRPARRLILATMCLGVLLAQLDTSVVNLAVGSIRTDLGASIGQLQWVVDAYNLVYAACLLTGGTLGDLYGRRRIFLAGTAVFTLGTLVCGLAPDHTILIGGRALTGLGAALELPTSLAILAAAYPDPAERAHAIGLWAGCNGIAFIIGPTLGGVLVDWLGWRSIFLLIIPTGLLAFALAWRTVPDSGSPQGREIDLRGQALAVLTLGLLAFVLIEAPHWGWLSMPTLGGLAASLALGVTFICVERGRDGALMPLDLFANRTFAAALIVAALMTFGMYALLFLLPLYLQSVRGETALMAGIALLPMSATFALVSSRSGRLATRVGARVMMTAGMLLISAGQWLLVLIAPDTSMPVIAVALLAIGVGLGLNTGPVMSAAVANAPRERAGTASGLVNTARMVGATLGVAVLGALFAAHASQAHATLPQFIAGLRTAFAVGGSFTLLGAGVALFFIRRDGLQGSAR